MSDVLVRAGAIALDGDGALVPQPSPFSQQDETAGGVPAPSTAPVPTAPTDEAEATANTGDPEPVPAR